MHNYIITLCGLAAIVGGLFWAVKAGAILLLNYQPPLIFEVAQILFVVGLIGLYIRLEGRSGRVGKAGVFIALLALAARLGATVYEFLPGAVISTDEQFIFPYSLFVFLGGVGSFIGLILLGVASIQAKMMPSPWNAVPLIAGLLSLPIAMTGLLHIEVPILLIGLAWIGVGYTIWRSAGIEARVTATRK